MQMYDIGCNGSISLVDWPIVIDNELQLSFKRIANIPFYAFKIKTDMNVEFITNKLQEITGLKIATVSISRGEVACDDCMQKIIVIPYVKGFLRLHKESDLLSLSNDHVFAMEKYGLIDNSAHGFLLMIERKLRKNFPLIAHTLAILSKKTNDCFVPKLVKREIRNFVGDEYSQNLLEANILVKITAASICQSDRRVLLCTKNSRFYEKDIILGHEGGGYIIDPGPWSDTLHSGQKVVCLPHLTCGVCSYCKAGTTNLCRDLSHAGFHFDGCIAEFVLLPRQTVRVIDDAFVDDAMPLVEPLACVIRALYKLRPQLDVLNKRYRSGDNSATPFTIYGSGPMGCIIATTVKMFWPYIKTRLLDISDTRIKIVSELKIADEAIHVNNFLCKHEISIVATSFFSAYMNCIKNTERGGYILAFSGINTDEQTKADFLVKYLEKLHRDELVDDYICEDGRKISLIGSSGYNQENVSDSIKTLLSHYNKYSKIQNAVVCGVDSSMLTYKNKKYAIYSSKIVEKLLSPKNLDDAKYGEIIQSILKVLIKM
ncbi:putative ADH_N domain-containing protein [Gammaproteobacteria bacterium]